MRPTESRPEAAASCPSCSRATLPGAYYAHGSSSSGVVPGARSIVVAGGGGERERSQEKIADEEVKSVMAESSPSACPSSRRELAKKIEDMKKSCQGTVTATVSDPDAERNNRSRAGRVRNARGVSGAATSGTTRPVVKKTCAVVEPASPPVVPAVTRTSFPSHEIAKATMAAAAAALSLERQTTSTTNTAAAAKATDANASIDSSAFDDSAVEQPASCHRRKQSSRTAKPSTNSRLLPPPPTAAITNPDDHRISQTSPDDDNDNDNDNNSSTTMDSDDLKIQQLRRQLLQLHDTPTRGQTRTTATTIPATPPPTRSYSISYPSAASSERHSKNNHSHGRQPLPYQRSTSVQLHVSDIRAQQLPMASVSLSSSSCSRNLNHDSNKNNNNNRSKSNPKSVVHDHDEGSIMPPADHSLDSAQDRSAHDGPHHNNNSVISTKNSNQQQYHHHHLVEKNSTPADGDGDCRTGVMLSSSHHGVSSSSHNAPTTAIGASGSRLHLMRHPSNDTDHTPKTHTSSHANKAVAGNRCSEAVTSASAAARVAGEGRRRSGGNIILLDVPQSGDVLGQMEAYQPSTTEQEDHLHNANQHRESQCTNSSHTRCTTTKKDDDDDGKGTNAGLASYSVPSPSSSASTAAPSSSRLLQHSVSAIHHHQNHRKMQHHANRHSAGHETMSTTSIRLSAGDEGGRSIPPSRRQDDKRTLQEQHPLSSSRNHGTADSEPEARKIPGSFSCCSFNDEGLNRKMKDFQQQLQEYEDRQEANNSNKRDKSVRFAINNNTDEGHHRSRPSSNSNNYASQSMPSLPTTFFGSHEDQHQQDVHTNTRSLSAPSRLNASSSNDAHHLHNKNKNKAVTRSSISVDDDDDPLFLKESAKQGVESKCSCAIM